MADTIEATLVQANLHIAILFTFIMGIIVCCFWWSPGKNDTTLSTPVWLSSLTTCVLMTCYASLTLESTWEKFSAFGALILAFALPNIGIGILLRSFPGWITPFSNTIGYMVSNFMYGADLANFNHKVNDEIKRHAFDPSVLLNAISATDLDKSGGDAIYKLLYATDATDATDATMSGGDDQEAGKIKDSIVSFVVLKDRIAYAVWVFLVASLTSTISARIVNDL
jgi:hypothetical protein